MKKIAVVLGLCLLGTGVFAQKEETLLGDAGLDLTGAWGGWSQSAIQANKEYESYSGGLWALEFGKKLSVGYQHYNMLNVATETGAPFSLRSRNLYLAYTPRSYRFLHPIIAVSAGNGRLTMPNRPSDKVLLVHPSAGIELNIVRWCHLDLQAGYRFLFNNNFAGFEDKQFSGAFAQANLKFGFSWGRGGDGRSGKKKYRDDD